MHYKCTYIDTARKLPAKFQNYFREAGSVHNYNLRSVANQNFMLHTAHTNYGLRMVHFTGPKLWNEIPLRIKSYYSVKHFSAQYKQYLLGGE